MTLENLTISQLRCVEGLCTCGAFERAFRVEPRPPMDVLIVDRVCARFNVTKEALVSPRRTEYLVCARWAAMYVLRTRTTLSLAEIGWRFNRGHDTVCYALRSIKELLRAKPAFAQMVAAVESDL